MSMFKSVSDEELVKFAIAGQSYLYKTIRGMHDNSPDWCDWVNYEEEMNNLKLGIEEMKEWLKQNGYVQEDNEQTVS